MLRWTRFGRHVFAIGGNEHAATLTGIPVRPIKVAVYMISALSAAIAGIVETGWLGAVTTNLGTGMELQVIAAAVIGGASLVGGAGTAIGALVGAALIEVIRNSLGLLGINAFWQGCFHRLGDHRRRGLRARQAVALARIAGGDHALPRPSTHEYRGTAPARSQTARVVEDLGLAIISGRLAAGQPAARRRRADRALRRVAHGAARGR